MTDYREPGITLEMKVSDSPRAKGPGDLKPHFIAHCFQVEEQADCGAYDPVAGVTGMLIPDVEDGATLVPSKCSVFIKADANGELIEIPEVNSGGTDNWEIDPTDSTIDLVAELAEITLDRSTTGSASLNQTSNVFSETGIDFGDYRIYPGYSKLTITHADYIGMGALDIAVNDDGNLDVLGAPVWPVGSATTALTYRIDLMLGGEVYVTYYAMRTDLCGTRVWVTDSNLKTTFGEDAIKVDNPLAFLAYICTQVCDGCYVTGVDDIDGATDDEDCDETAWGDQFTYIKTLTRDDTAYSFVIGSQNQSVISLFELFIDFMRDPDELKLSTGWATIKRRTEDVQMDTSTCPAVPGGGTKVFTDATKNFVTEEVAAGHWLELTDPNDVKTFYRISVVAATTLDLMTTLPATVDATWSYRVLSKIYNMMDEAEYYRNYAQGFANMAFRLAFPGTLTLTYQGEDHENVPAYYWWALRVGYMSNRRDISQPYTNERVTWSLFKKSELPYKDRTFLNTIASGGVEIIMQDTDTDYLYCRHQLTTDMSTTATKEQTGCHQYDYAAMVIERTFRPYIGRVVISNKTIAMFKALFSAAAQYVLKRALQSLRLTSIMVSEEDDTWLAISGDATMLRPCNGAHITLYLF